ncbi:MAG TPA: tetratricopeptide repeat protein, partial [Longimicrobiaceae bacterium]|nr:tetratricopeptide repeat protein [Longimicrobiaceae bacterium]
DLRLASTEAEVEAGPSIAVLPFADMSPEGDQEYFSDGMTEELINTLAKIRDLTVMARTSAFAFKGANLDMRAVGDSLGVQYLVEGSVRKAGNELRITAQLIDAQDGAHLWSDTYDRRLENVFEIQREIAEAIAGELRVPLGLQENERLVSPTEDLAAYDLYLAGRARMRDRGESVREAVQLFEAAIARDSSWAPAWAGLAESRTLIPYYPMAWEDSTLWAQSLSGAESAATRALALDVDNASALVALGSVHRDRWDWDEAEDAYRRALRIDPESVEGLQQYAELLMYAGRMDEAYRIARQALELDPSAVRMNAMALAAWLAGRPAEAIRTFEAALASQEDPLMAQKLNSNLLRVYQMTGSWSDVRRLLIDRFEADDPALAQRVRSGWTAAADPPPVEVVELLDEEWPGGATGIMLMTGRSDRVLDRLEAQYSGMPPFGPSLSLWSPIYDPLRDDPRFQAILASRGLEGLKPQRLEPGDEP